MNNLVFKFDLLYQNLEDVILTVLGSVDAVEINEVLKKDDIIDITFNLVTVHGEEYASSIRIKNNKNNAG